MELGDGIILPFNGWYRISVSMYQLIAMVSLIANGRLAWQGIQIGLLHVHTYGVSV
ncbi:MAG: hypothetical protein OXG05_07380 [Gammaproteobacteria bacterium]|nr:hypothetical protein [Gammaproteobacteria bacterium]